MKKEWQKEQDDKGEAKRILKIHLLKKDNTQHEMRP